MADFFENCSGTHISPFGHS